jgi:hypothetical protein
VFAGAVDAVRVLRDRLLLQCVLHLRHLPAGLDLARHSRQLPAGNFVSSLVVLLSTVIQCSCFCIHAQVSVWTTDLLLFYVFTEGVFGESWCAHRDVSVSRSRLTQIPCVACLQGPLVLVRAWRHDHALLRNRCLQRIGAALFRSLQSILPCCSERLSRGPHLVPALHVCARRFVSASLTTLSTRTSRTAMSRCCERRLVVTGSFVLILPAADAAAVPERPGSVFTLHSAHAAVRPCFVVLLCSLD